MGLPGGLNHSISVAHGLPMVCDCGERRAAADFLRSGIVRCEPGSAAGGADGGISQPPRTEINRSVCSPLLSEIYYILAGQTRILLNWCEATSAVKGQVAPCISLRAKSLDDVDARG